MKFTNVSDGSGESAVKKVDVSALATNGRGQACTRATIEKIWWQCNGMKVKVLFDASTDAFCIDLEKIKVDIMITQALVDYKTSSSGVTGDIMFTTVGHSSADTYTVIMQVRKSYN